MPDFQLVDEKNGHVAGVSNLGEQYVAPRFYSDPYYVQVDAAATAFEVVPGIPGKRFIVTGLLLASNKAFASSIDAETLTIYEAIPSELDVNIKTFTQVDLLRNDRLVATGLNLRTSATVSLVAIATDASVDVTIAGYYINA